MDRRQALDQFGAAVLVGDIADDIVVACAHASSGLLPADREAVDRAMGIIEMLLKIEDPTNLTSGSLQCMGPLAFKSAVATSKVANEQDTVDYLQKIGSDLRHLRDDPPAIDDSVQRRLKIFFESLSEHTLTYSRSVLDTFGHENQWMFAALSY